MPTNQSTSERRRRVLYSSQSDTAPSTAASRRAKQKLREARQPTKAYGAKVQRRLRGRWFSLVPVRRRTLCTWAAIIAGISLLLTYAHYASVTWPSLAYAPEIARPLRLDRPDSFGRWFICVLLGGSAGASLLIYQLRRYRNDDFRGQYRLWRLVVVVLLLTSINSLVSFVDWGGSLLDWMFGRRVAFSGYDWLRIVLGVAGVVLALRMIAEVRRSRWALACILIAGGLLALPEATKWQLIEVETIQRWAMITAAPLLGYTALFLGLGGYLRMLYREVRGIKGEETLARRWQSYREEVAARKEEELEAKRALAESSPRKRRRAAAKPVEEEYVEEEEYEEEVAEQELAEQSEPDVEEQEETPPRKRRRWFGLRAAKAPASQVNDDQEQPEEDEPVAEEPSRRKKKKRRLGIRLDPQENEETPAEVDASNEEQETPTRKKRGFGLSWRKKKPKVEDVDSEVEEPQGVSEQEQAVIEQPAAAAPAGNEELDPDDIDWNALSKSERRRLRKKLKRQGRAA